MRRAEGHITEVEAGKLYRIRVTAGTNPKTGKPYRPCRTVRGTRKQAERALTSLLLEVGKGKNARMTLGDFVDFRFLPHRRAELKQTSYEGYVRRIDNHIRGSLGDVYLDELSPAVVRSALDDLPTPAVRREVRKMLNMICQDAVFEGALESNPVAKVRPPKVPVYEPPVLDIEDIEVYLWHFAGTRIEPLFLLALGCGLRRGELCALTVEDINLATGAVSVTKEVVPVKGGVLQDAPKSHASVRTVHMPRFLLDRLIPLLPETGAVFGALDGSQLRPESVSHIYRKALETLPPDVPRVSLKNLRHTSLTLAYETTGDILAAKERAGHSSVSITTRYYVRPTGLRDVAAAERMGAAFSGDSQG